MISGLAGVEEQLTGLLSKQKDVSQKEVEKDKANTALEQAIKKLDGYNNQCGMLKKELGEAVIKHRQGKDALSDLLDGRLLREYRTEKETLLRKMTYLTTIAKYEDHRAKLKDGKECPLCGSKEHPFAEGNIPVLDETEKKIEALIELIRKAEDQEVAIKKLEEVESAANKQLIESEKIEAVAANDKKGAERSLSDLTSRLTIARSEFIDFKNVVSKKLQPLGIEAIPDSNVPSLLDSLKERLEKWLSQVKKKTEVEKRISELNLSTGQFLKINLRIW